MTTIKNDYAVLEYLDLLLDGKLSRILNRSGAANSTICPECGIDDFVHVEGCSIGDDNVPAEVTKLLREGLSPDE